MENARYTSVAVALHWAIAILILGQIAGGLYMHNLPNTAPAKFDLYQLHKSFGLSILLLSFIRLGWRFTHRAPPLPAAMPGWQKLAARGVHWAFYALMIITPLVGWSIVSVSPKDIATHYFGLFEVPHLPFFDGVTDREGTEELFEEVHEYLAFTILGLFALHVGAALKHMFINRDGVFSSMAPAALRQWAGITGIFAVLGLFSVLYLAAPAQQTAAVDASVLEHSHEAAEERHGDAVEEPADEIIAEQVETAPAETVVEEEVVVEETISEPVAVKPVSTWAVDYENSSLVFIGEESGRSFEGAFSNFTADITFDPDHLEESKVSVKVQTASARTGDELIDASLPGSEWFAVKEHPKAIFASNAIRRTGEGAYEATGMLTIKGFSHEITLPFTLHIDGDNAHATGGVNLIRTDYGLGMADSWLEEENLSLNVRVEFEITATRKN